MRLWCFGLWTGLAVFRLKVKCYREEGEMVNSSVTSAMLEWLPGGSQYPEESETKMTAFMSQQARELAPARPPGCVCSVIQGETTTAKSSATQFHNTTKKLSNHSIPATFIEYVRRQLACPVVGLVGSKRLGCASTLWEVVSPTMCHHTSGFNPHQPELTHSNI